MKIDLNSCVNIYNDVKKQPDKVKHLDKNERKTLLFVISYLSDKDVNLNIKKMPAPDAINALENKLKAQPSPRATNVVLSVFKTIQNFFNMRISSRKIQNNLTHLENHITKQKQEIGKIDKKISEVDNSILIDKKRKANLEEIKSFYYDMQEFYNSNLDNNIFTAKYHFDNKIKELNNKIDKFTEDDKIYKKPYYENIIKKLEEEKEFFLSGITLNRGYNYYKNELKVLYERGPLTYRSFGKAVQSLSKNLDDHITKIEGTINEKETELEELKYTKNKIDALSK